MQRTQLLHNGSASLRSRVVGLPFVFDDGGRAAAGFKGRAGDCACRAIAIASQQPYQVISDCLTAAVNEYAAKHRDRTARTILQARGKKACGPQTGMPREVIRKFLRSIGWEWTPTMHIGSGCVVHLRPGELPAGRLIVQVSTHLVAVIDGVMHDTHDCSRRGTRCVYGYWHEGTKQ